MLYLVGYTIDADVDSVTVSTVTGGAPSPTSTPTTSSGSSSGGSSSNTGAIVGGVVGGIVGLALITLLAVWLYTHNKRKRNLVRLICLEMQKCISVQNLVVCGLILTVGVGLGICLITQS